MVYHAETRISMANVTTMGILPRLRKDQRIISIKTDARPFILTNLNLCMILTQMKKISVIGSPGAGKSTFAAELGWITQLPVIHLDKEFWQPGWVEMPREEWRERVSALVEADNWIIDGTYDNSLDIRLPRADAVIFLDFPRYLCIWRICKRFITNFGRACFDMAEGCPEILDWSFLKWVWNYRRDHYPKIHEYLLKYFPHGSLFVLKNQAEVRRFIQDLG
jgi:adenylate kinase family enzyme